MATYTTYATAVAAYRANADYRSTGSVASARICVDAIESILTFLPKVAQSAGGGERIEWNASDLRQMQSNAQSWLASRSSSGTARGGFVRGRCP